MVIFLTVNLETFCDIGNISSLHHAIDRCQVTQALQKYYVTGFMLEILRQIKSSIQ